MDLPVQSVDGGARRIPFLLQFADSVAEIGYGRGQFAASTAVRADRERVNLGIVKGLGQVSSIRFLRDGRYLRDVQGHTIEKVLGVRPSAG